MAVSWKSENDPTLTGTERLNWYRAENLYRTLRIMGIAIDTAELLARETWEVPYINPMVEKMLQMQIKLHILKSRAFYATTAPTPL